MSKRVYKATIGCTRKQYKEVIRVGTNVDKNAYNDYASEFVNLPMSKLAYESILKTAVDAESAAETGGPSETATRNIQVGLLFDYLDNQLVPAVNMLYKGVKDSLLHSGLPVSSDPESVVPGAPIIKKAETVSGTTSVKLTLARVKNPLKKKRVRVIYFVWMTDDPTKPDTWKQVLAISNGRKLIVPGMVRLKDVFFAVSAKSEAGESELSGHVKYTLV